MAAIGVMEFAFVFLSGFFGLGLSAAPLAVPPLPEDPVIARIAPDEALYFWSSAGMATPDPNSPNHTEQLFAEQELQKLVATIESRLIEAVERQANDPESRLLAAHLPPVIKTALTRPMAVFVSSFALGESGPEIEAGLVVNAGDDTPALEANLKGLEELILRGEAAEEIEADGVTWRVLPLPEKAPPVAWGVKGKYILLAVGKDAGAAMLDRARTEPPAWYAKLKEQLPVERVSTISYLNLAGVKRAAGPLLDSPLAGKIMNATGLHNAQYLASITGMDKQGCVSHGLLALEGPPQGALAAFGAKSLSKRDLARLPADSIFAMATSIDAKGVYDTAVEILGTFEPRAVEQMEAGLGELEQLLGASLPRDVLPALGDVWTVSTSPADGGFPWFGAVASVSVRDRAVIAKVHDRLVAMARQELSDPPERRRRAITIRDFDYAGQKVFFVNAIGEEMPFAPAWCLTEDALVVALFPQSIKAYLVRDEDAGSLTDVPQVGDALGDSAPPFGLTYIDTRTLFRTVYPLLQIGGQLACSEMQREGIDIDISLLPSAATIEKHLQPGISVISRTPDGFRMTSRQTLPTGGSLGTLPLTIAMFVPAVGSARTAARTTGDMNNLKQIALAMHNYHATFGKFPAAIHSDEDGKPLLSWRVAILPFIEQRALYEQFRLDEPWDSEHNRKLMNILPVVYRSSDGADRPGTTRFVTLRGEQTAFPGSKGTRLTEINDGTSNTIMAVQVGPQAAVEWTKPDDVPADPKKLRAAVANRQGSFLAAFCDGHVRKISLGISDALLEALSTRAGKETIDHDKLMDRSGHGAPHETTTTAREAPVEQARERPRRVPVPVERAPAP